MEPQWRSLQDPTARRVWQEVLRPVAAQLLTCATELAGRIVERYQGELPKVVPDAPAVAEQLASVEASLRQIAKCVERGDDPRRLDLTAPTSAIARSGVQRNIPLNDLFRSVRLAQEETWQWLFGRITASLPVAEQPRALDLANNWLFGYVDTILIHAEQHYEAEREAWLRGAAAVRAEAVDDILKGREDNPQRASKRLHYEINRHHVGVRIWVDAAREVSDAQATLNDTLARLTRAASAQSTLVNPLGSMAIAGWLTRSQAYTGEETDRTAALGDTDLPDGVLVAIGEPGWGIGGFRRSHNEASHAHRLASLLGDRADVVTCYRRVAVAALACADAGHAVAFVKRILGPLAANDEATYRIATTLAVYLEENRSPARAGQRLIVHPNTVSYRINQAEALLGRPIDRNAVELSVALALLPAMPGLLHRGGAEL